MALHYFKTNVRYVIGGRRFLGDANGFTLTAQNPVIEVEEKDLRNFKIANKRALLEGLIVETAEPSLDWETDNAITDDEARELVKSFPVLKKRLETVSSYSTALKLLDFAKEDGRPDKTVKLIEAKVSELEPTPEDFSEDVLKAREVQ